MQLIAVLVAVASLSSPALLAEAVKVGQLKSRGGLTTKTAENPLTGAITLLEQLKKDAKTEGQEEEAAYAKFSHWCNNMKQELGGDLQQTGEKIESLTDELSGKTEEEKLLKEQIDKLKAEIADIEAAVEKADGMRKKESDKYEEVKENLEATNTAVGESIGALKDAKPAAALQLTSLLQVISAKEDRDAIQDFIRSKHRKDEAEDEEATERPELKAKGDRKEETYVSKTDTVIEILKGLQTNFTKKLDAANLAETRAIAAHDLVKKAYQDKTDAANAALTEKNDRLGEVEAAIALADSTVGDEKDNKDADTTQLRQVTEECSMKKIEYAERTQTRNKEIKALDVAIGVLTKEAGGRYEAPENPVPPPNPAEAFIQSKASLAATDLDEDADEDEDDESEDDEDDQEGLDDDLSLPGQTEHHKRAMEAIQMLRAAGTSLKLESLQALAQELDVQKDGPFDQVMNEIEKMVFHLKNEQNEEDKHKMWCDNELNKTETSYDLKDTKHEDLEAKINLADTQIGELTTAIKNCNDKIDTMNSHMAEAREIREVGKQENKKALNDAVMGQEALAKAQAVLEQFYKENGMLSSSLLQQDPPSTWETDDNQNDGRSSQILSLLKTLMEDYASLEAEIRANEENDAKLHLEDEAVSKAELAKKTTQSRMKSQQKQRLVAQATSLKKALKVVSDQKDKVSLYLEDLKEACDVNNTAETYEDRKNARTAEIEALGKAKMILSVYEDSDEVAAVLKGGGRKRKNRNRNRNRKNKNKKNKNKKKRKNKRRNKNKDKKR